MQISRLFQIIYILLEKGTVTAAELAERFEVSVRTIYRDIDALCQAGIPVYASQGKGGGISLSDRFILNKSFLSEKEQDEILLALQSFSAVRYPELDKVLSKLSGLFQKSDVSWIDVDLSSWGNGEREKEFFSLLKNAILEQRIIRFTYFSAAGEKSDRTVEPVRLLYKDKAWYLQGYCLQRMACRTFKIARMADVTVTGQSCNHQKDWNTAMQPREKESAQQTVNLKLKVLPEGAYRVYEDFSEKEITKLNDGSFLVTVSMPGGEWLYPYLFSFGTALEVLEPQGIRNETARRLKNMAEQYFIT